MIIPRIFLVGALALGLALGYPKSAHSSIEKTKEVPERRTKFSTENPQYYELRPNEIVCFYDSITGRFLTKFRETEGIKARAIFYNAIVYDEDGLEKIFTIYKHKEHYYDVRAKHGSPAKKIKLDTFMQEPINSKKGRFVYRIIDVRGDEMRFYVPLEIILEKATQMKTKPINIDKFGRLHCDKQF